MNPKIVLFDEPTSALDPEMVKEVLDFSDLFPSACGWLRRGESPAERVLLPFVW